MVEREPIMHPEGFQRPLLEQIQERYPEQEITKETLQEVLENSSFPAEFEKDLFGGERFEDLSPAEQISQENHTRVMREELKRRPELYRGKYDYNNGVIAFLGQGEDLRVAPSEGIMAWIEKIQGLTEEEKKQIQNKLSPKYGPPGLRLIEVLEALGSKKVGKIREESFHGVPHSNDGGRWLGEKVDSLVNREAKDILSTRQIVGGEVK